MTGKPLHGAAGHPGAIATRPLAQRDHRHSSGAGVIATAMALAQFEASGLEGWTTERTGDDGVDAVVTNRDPMIGGLTIVQAKNGRVELIDGPRLRYLVKEHLHKDVLVAPPAPRARTWQP
jgi:hypothetical protein